MIEQFRFTFRMCLRFLRSHRLRSPCSGMFAVGFCVLAMYVVLAGQSLTGEQLVTKDLGRFGATAGYGTTGVSPGEPAVAALSSQLKDLIGPSGRVALTAQDFPVPEVSDSGVFYKEMDWGDDPFPGKYEVLEGNLPTAANEVAIADSGHQDIHVGDEFPLVGRSPHLKVVGLVDDIYTSSPALLAGPGTWAGIDSRVRSGYPALNGQTLVYWSGAKEARVLSAIMEFAASREQSTAGDDLRRVVQDSLSTRKATLASSSGSWISKAPAGYTIPSLLVPPVLALLIFGLSLGSLRPALTTMRSLGVRRSTAVLSVWSATSLLCVTFALVGSLVGAGAGSPIAHVVANVTDNPPPVFPSLWAPLARMVVMTVIGCLMGAFVLDQAASHRASPRPSKSTTSHRMSDIRQVLAVGVAGVCVLQIPRLDSPAKALILAGTISLAVVLIVPDLVRVVVKLLPEKGPIMRLCKRQLQTDHVRVVGAVALLALVVGMSVGFLSLLNTQIRTAETQSYPLVLPGQVTLSDRGADSLPVPRGARAAADTVEFLRDQKPVQLRFLGLTEDDLATRVVAGDSDGVILALDTTRDVERLLGTLSGDQAATLRDGGMVIWEDPAPPGGEVELHLTSPNTAIATIPFVRTTTPRVEWALGRAGVMLTSTAKVHKMPIITGAVLYTDVPSSDAKALLSALMTRGIDPKTASTYKEPPPVIPQPALVVTALGLVVLVLTIVTVATRTQTTSLRTRASHLLAIGLPPTWCRRVIAGQQLVMLAMATVIGLIIGAAPTLLAVWRISGFVLEVPWYQIATLLSAIYLATFVVFVVSLRKVTPRERLEVA